MSTDMEDLDPTTAQAAHALEVSKESVKNGMLKDVSCCQIYESKYIGLTRNLELVRAQGDGVNFPLIFAEIAGGASAYLYAVRHINKLEAELKAIKEMFNLP